MSIQERTYSLGSTSADTYTLHTHTTQQARKSFCSGAHNAQVKGDNATAPARGLVFGCRLPVCRVAPSQKSSAGFRFSGAWSLVRVGSGTGGGGSWRQSLTAFSRECAAQHRTAPSAETWWRRWCRTCFPNASIRECDAVARPLRPECALLLRCSAVALRAPSCAREC